MNLFKVKQTEEISTTKTFCKLVLEPESEAGFYIKKKDAMQWQNEKAFLMIDVKEHSEILENEINFQEIRAKREGWGFRFMFLKKTLWKKQVRHFL